MISNYKLTEGAHPVVGLVPTSNPSSTAVSWVSMKNYNRLSIIITAANDGTGAAMAVALNQATAYAGTGSKALAFTTVDAIVDLSVTAADTFVPTAVVSNTFNTTATASKNSIYIIEVTGAMLDVANSFDYVSVASLTCAHTIASVLYILRDPRYPQSTDTQISAIV